MTFTPAANSSPTTFTGNVCTIDTAQPAATDTISCALFVQPVTLVKQEDNSYAGYVNLPINVAITDIKVMNFNSTALPSGVTLDIGISGEGSEIASISNFAPAANSVASLLPQLTAGYAQYFATTSEEHYIFFDASSQLTDPYVAGLQFIVEFYYTVG